MKSTYHHGDLRQQLIASALLMINEEGVEGLSLRKLALKVGVSRTAPYHHFKDKHELLCAIVEHGFSKLQQHTESVLVNEGTSLDSKFRCYFNGYIEYAMSQPELYELMFSRLIWKSNQITDQLHAVAYPCFSDFVEQISQWQQQGLLDDKEPSLRLAQVSWGMMHGMARLLIDGIYVDQKAIEEMCNTAVNVLVKNKC